MAGDEIADVIGGDRAADRARGTRLPNAAGETGIGGDPARGYAQQRLQVQGLADFSALRNIYQDGAYTYVGAPASSGLSVIVR